MTTISNVHGSQDLYAQSWRACREIEHTYIVQTRENTSTLMSVDESITSTLNQSQRKCWVGLSVTNQFANFVVQNLCPSMCRNQCDNDKIFI